MLNNKKFFLINKKKEDVFKLILNLEFFLMLLLGCNCKLF